MSVECLDSFGWYRDSLLLVLLVNSRSLHSDYYRHLYPDQRILRCDHNTLSNHHGQRYKWAIPVANILYVSMPIRNMLFIATSHSHSHSLVQPSRKHRNILWSIGRLAFNLWTNIFELHGTKCNNIQCDCQRRRRLRCLPLLRPDNARQSAVQPTVHTVSSVCA